MNRQLFQYHPNIGYTFIPGLKTRVEHNEGGYLIRVNSSGFRSDWEFEPSKRPGVFRVLVFGDSFTAADRVSNKQRYTDVLAALLPGVEVYNFGLSGTGTDQQYLAYQEYANGIEHDLLVISVLVENIRRVASRYRTFRNREGQEVVFAKPYFTLAEDGTLLRHHKPVPKEHVSEKDLPPEERPMIDRGGRFLWLRQVVNKFGFGLNDLAQRVLRYQPLPEYNSPEYPAWQVIRALLEQWIAESPVPVVLMPIPLYQHVERTASPRKYQARFRELAQQTGATVHDPLPDYLEVSRQERRGFRFKTDVHPTPASHRLLAESLASCIRGFMDERS